MADPTTPMTVGELKEILDGYGDHLVVVVHIEKGNREETYRDLEVMDGTGEAGEPEVQIGVWT